MALQAELDTYCGCLLAPPVVSCKQHLSISEKKTVALAALQHFCEQNSSSENPPTDGAKHQGSYILLFLSFLISYYTCLNAILPNHPPPQPFPQSPKDCSIHLCLFCCFTYRVIVTIFLNSIYMH